MLQQLRAQAKTIKNQQGKFKQNAILGKKNQEAGLFYPGKTTRLTKYMQNNSRVFAEQHFELAFAAMSSRCRADWRVTAKTRISPANPCNVGNL